jgi:ribosomal protein S18 acetylase RimI-like enzyme
MNATRSAQWRSMTRSDLPDVERVGDLVHPAYPEEEAVIAERLSLYPAGCLVLADNHRIQGYALGHPWLLGHPPTLNARLNTLPDKPDTFYIHDLALLPETRRLGAGTTAIRLLAHRAERDGLTSLSLVAVSDSTGFWQRNGFEAVALAGMRTKLASYGASSRFMVRWTFPPP